MIIICGLCQREIKQIDRDSDGTVDAVFKHRDCGKNLEEFHATCYLNMVHSMRVAWRALDRQKSLSAAEKETEENMTDEEVMQKRLAERCTQEQLEEIRRQFQNGWGSCVDNSGRVC